MPNDSIHSTLFKNLKLEQAYGIFCKSFLKQSDERETFAPGFTYCKVPAKGETTRHTHSEKEVFLFLKGHGVVKVGDEIISVYENTSVEILPQNEHQIINTSPNQELELISVHWNQPKGESSL